MICLHDLLENAGVQVYKITTTPVPGVIMLAVINLLRVDSPRSLVSRDFTDGCLS